MIKNYKIQLFPKYELNDKLPHGQFLISSSIGPKGEVYILISNQTNAGAQVYHNRPAKYQVLVCKNGYIDSVTISKEKMNFHIIQPIGDRELLLVCARSQFRGEKDFDLNARVFDYQGNLLREFLLGDGIEDVKVSPNGTIWTSYFDEGVFGNFGWIQPIGSAGLRSWDINGRPIYEYDSPNYDLSIADCYAINVPSNDTVWFYFYTNFYLTKLHIGQLRYWETEIGGSDGFVIFKDLVMFRGGYNERDLYQLFRISDGNKLTKVGSVIFLDEDGNQFNADKIDCRGNMLMIQKGLKVYEFILKKENLI